MLIVRRDAVILLFLYAFRYYFLSDIIFCRFSIFIFFIMMAFMIIFSMMPLFQLRYYIFDIDI